MSFVFLIFCSGAITSTLALFLFSHFKFPSIEELLPIFLNGIFINGVSYIFWIMALKTISITSAAVFVFLTPVFSMVWILVLFNEQFYLSYIIGGSVVLITSLYCLMQKVD